MCLKHILELVYVDLMFYFLSKGTISIADQIFKERR